MYDQKVIRLAKLILINNKNLALRLDSNNVFRDSLDIVKNDAKDCLDCFKLLGCTADKEIREELLEVIVKDKQILKDLLTFFRYQSKTLNEKELSFLFEHIWNNHEDLKMELVVIISKKGYGSKIKRLKLPEDVTEKIEATKLLIKLSKIK